MSETDRRRVPLQGVESFEPKPKKADTVALYARVDRADVDALRERAAKSDPPMKLAEMVRQAIHFAVTHMAAEDGK